MCTWTQAAALLDCPDYLTGHASLQCLNLTASDIIVCCVPASQPRQRPKHIIMFRNMKTVSASVQSTLVSTHLMADNLVAHYNSALSHCLNALPPIKTRTVSFNGFALSSSLGPSKTISGWPLSRRTLSPQLHVPTLSLCSRWSLWDHWIGHQGQCLLLLTNQPHWWRPVPPPVPSAQPSSTALQPGTVPTNFKIAFVTLILIKPGMTLLIVGQSPTFLSST